MDGMKATSTDERQPLAAEASLLAAGHGGQPATCQPTAAKTHGPPSPKLRPANPMRLSRRPTILVFPCWWAAPAHTTKSQFRRVCEETPNFATSIPRSPSLTKQHLCPVVDIAARQDGCWQVRRTPGESTFGRIAPPRALVGRVWADSRWLILGLQEQETVQGQEGPQEEGPGPLRPQGLVRHQGELQCPPRPRSVCPRANETPRN